MSAYTTVQIQFDKPDGITTLTVANPNVTVPNTNLSTTLGLFLANQYAYYVFQPGDVDQSGLWTARVIYQDGTPQHLISDVGTFTVGK
jgi:hypothetical protein